MKYISRRAAILLSILALAACGKSSESAPAPAAPTTAVASNPAIQKIYDSSCRTCHGSPASGAPQAGDSKAWAPRVAQGRDVILGHILNGYQKMPPMGLCMQCSEDDFVALTEFMSGSQLK